MVIESTSEKPTPTERTATAMRAIAADLRRRADQLEVLADEVQHEHRTPHVDSKSLLPTRYQSTSCPRGTLRRNAYGASFGANGLQSPLDGQKAHKMTLAGDE
jgi:hypothetical protein